MELLWTQYTPQVREPRKMCCCDELHWTSYNDSLMFKSTEHFCAETIRSHNRHEVLCRLWSALQPFLKLWQLLQSNNDSGGTDIFTLYLALMPQSFSQTSHGWTSTDRYGLVPIDKRGPPLSVIINRIGTVRALSSAWTCLCPMFPCGNYDTHETPTSPTSKKTQTQITQMT